MLLLSSEDSPHRRNSKPRAAASPSVPSASPTIPAIRMPAARANWLDVTAWGKTAEFVCKYFPKGALIAIDGRLQTRQYQDKNGQNRTATEIVAQNVNFCGSKESTSPAPQNAAQRPAAPSQRTQGEPDADYAPIDDDEGDLPF